MLSLAAADLWMSFGTFLAAMCTCWVLQNPLRWVPATTYWLNLADWPRGMVGGPSGRAENASLKAVRFSGRPSRTDGETRKINGGNAS